MINRENVLAVLAKTKNKAHIIAATKYGTSSDIRMLYDLGIKDIGENKVDSLIEKQNELTGLAITWHFIGHLQRNKVKRVINKIDFLHSVDSLELLSEIEKYREKVLPVFIEVNISDETSKHGIKVEEFDNFLQKATNYDKISVIGIMGMAEHTDDCCVISNSFNKLVEINKKYDNRFKLSMGMSNDYEIALDCNTDYVRIGSLFYKE